MAFRIRKTDNFGTEYAEKGDDPDYTASFSGIWDTDSFPGELFGNFSTNTRQLLCLTPTKTPENHILIFEKLSCSSINAGGSMGFAFRAANDILSEYGQGCVLCVYYKTGETWKLVEYNGSGFDELDSYIGASPEGTDRDIKIIVRNGYIKVYIDGILRLDSDTTYLADGGYVVPARLYHSYYSLHKWQMQEHKKPGNMGAL